MARAATKHPLHSFHWKTSGTNVWIECRCGAVSPVFDSFAEQQKLVAWANEHSGFGGRRGLRADQVVIRV